MRHNRERGTAVFGACSGTRFAPLTELVSAGDLTYGTAGVQVLERRAAHGFAVRSG